MAASGKVSETALPIIKEYIPRFLEGVAGHSSEENEDETHSEESGNSSDSGSESESS